MSSLSDRLDAYDALSADERAELARAVSAAGDAELAARLAEEQAFEALLGAASPAALDVATYVTDRRLGRPVDLASEARIAADPQLSAEAVRVDARLDAMAAGMDDPLVKLERLTGHRVTPTGASTRDRAADRAAAPASRTARVRRLRLVRGLAVAAAVCVAAYGGLALVSSATLPERARVADLDAALDYRQPTLRGDAGVDPGAPLVAALDRLDEARSSTLGLFPRYDARALDGVAEELRGVADAAAGSQSAVHQEALLTLGRVYLHQGDREAAARVLREVVALGDYAAPEARRLLDFAQSAGAG